MISTKTEAELEIMRSGGRILAEILGELRGLVTAGRRTMELEEATQKLLSEHGVSSPFQGYEGYPFATCISVNDEVVHGLPGAYQLQPGDIVGIDLGVTHQGLMVDSAITVGVEPLSEPDRRLLEVTRRALDLGVKEARAGKTLGDIGSVVQRYVEGEGFGVVRALTGHGIGRSLHEEPSVPNYGEPGEGLKLEAGMSICIEPMVTAGSWEVVSGGATEPVRTKDGSRAAHFEHTVAVTARGPEILTRA